MRKYDNDWLLERCSKVEHVLAHENPTAGIKFAHKIIGDITAELHRRKREDKKA